MLTAMEIHKILLAEFPQAVGPWREPPGGASPEITVDPLMLHFIGDFIKKHGELRMTNLRGIWASPRADGQSVVYDLSSPQDGHEICLRVELPIGCPFLLTVADIWPSAAWHEMEVEGASGIHFETHPDCTFVGCGLKGRGTRCLRLTGGPAPFIVC